MSITTSALLILFLLCIISFHECNASPLRCAIGKEPAANKFLIPNKTDERSSLSNKLGDDSMVVNKARVDKDIDHQKPKSSKAADDDDDADEESDDLGEHSVSWSVPHTKRGEKLPGFNMDYAPPKTHPPVHN